MDEGSTSSASDGSGCGHPTKRKAPPAERRKLTYYKRKDEIQALHDQIQNLEKKLAKHKHEAREASLTNDVLDASINLGMRTIAGAQSMMTAYNQSMSQSSGAIPLHTFIHLPPNPGQRQAVLASLFAAKIPAAISFMTERTRFLDLRVEHRHTEQFDFPNGDVSVVATGVTQFRSGHSLRQVYDALMYFQNHSEMSFSEKLGVVAVRESEEPEDVQFSQTRLLSSAPSGLKIESNAVALAVCTTATDDTPAYAVGVVDFVDQDDLHPYRPDEYARKDVTCVVVLRELVSLDGEKPAVVMTRWSHVRMPRPLCPVSDEAYDAVRQGMLEWCEVIPSIIRERLSTIPPSL